MNLNQLRPFMVLCSYVQTGRDQYNPWYAKVIKVNKKTVSVVTERGERVRVLPSAFVREARSYELVGTPFERAE